LEGVGALLVPLPGRVPLVGHQHLVVRRAQRRVHPRRRAARLGALPGVRRQQLRRAGAAVGTVSVRSLQLADELQHHQRLPQTRPPPSTSVGTSPRGFAASSAGSFVYGAAGPSGCDSDSTRTNGTPRYSSASHARCAYGQNHAE